MTDYNPKKLLGDLLVDEGLISSEQLQQALIHQRKHGGFLGDVLLQLGFIKDRTSYLLILSKYHIANFLVFVIITKKFFCYYLFLSMYESSNIVSGFIHCPDYTIFSRNRQEASKPMLHF